MTGHLDTFARDSLPPKEKWPPLIFDGARDLEYPDTMNCAEELLDGAIERGWGDKPCIKSDKVVWSYREFLAKTNRIANYLTSELKLIPGNRVLIHGPNTPMIAACWFAVLKAGGICVTTMPLLRAKELSYTIEKAKIEFALSDARCVHEVMEAQKTAPSLKHIVPFLDESPDALEQCMERHPETFSNVETSAEDVALIAFTSGTTGKAKATMHFHRDVMTICDCFPQSVLKPTSHDVFAGTPPLAFTFGLGGILLFPLRYGASTVLIEKPVPAELLSAIESHKITTLFTSPTGYRGLLDSLEGRDISTLHSCVSAGENLPKATFDLWEQKTGVKIIDGIGATEMLHIFISASGDDIRPGSTGKVVHGYQARIVNESGVTLPAGEVGLLAVRGPTGCRYLDDVERQAAYVRNGWNYTGDAYRMDSDGYFWFEARADDMIISSGYNISANEVENTLLTHPKVKECGVIGKPDAQRGNIVKAYVVLRDRNDNSGETVKLLQDFVKAEIAPYKYPREVEFVEMLPRTETGKLQRFRLRAA